VSSNDINALNKRLQWQIINQIRDLKYVRLDQTFLRLMIFIDSSFVNNSDLFSQIDYVICLADATHANILHWSSIKCKKIIRNVLAAELVAMIHDFDVKSVLNICKTGNGWQNTLLTDKTDTDWRGWHSLRKITFG
jgi:hypothetical protein